MARLVVLAAVLAALAALSGPALVAAPTQDSERPPNVVLILADDMGWGDARCFHPDSRIPTPHLDRLAAEGMRFTDAHSPGAWCVPSRYGLLTGQAPWRVRQFRPNAGPVLGADQVTLAGLLRDAGYATAMVGKWHLGFEGGPDTAGEDKHGGPLDRGFDRFFGIHASLDIPPYYYLDGRTPVAPPTETVEDRNTPGWTNIQGEFWRGGACAPGFVHAEVLPRFTERAVAWVEELAAGEAPFFLYLALASPHTPWFSSGRFETGADLYGAFVADTDAGVGAVLAALDRAGVADRTLVVFTSDNGPVWYPADVARFGHSATGPYRGMKSDAWEGGHRMPFVVRWPGRVPAGTTCARTVSFTDVLPTLAALVDAPVADTDGFSLLPALADPDASTGREVTVLKADASVVRQGRWKLVTHLGSGGFSTPRREEPAAGGPTGQLYDLHADPGETTNLWSEHPDVVARLREHLRAATEEVTYESLLRAFRRGVIALHDDADDATTALNAEIAALAAATFGAHPELMRREAVRRYRALPPYPHADLSGWTERAAWDLTASSGPPAEEAWALFGWEPERLAAWAKSALLSRELGAEAFGRRALLSAYSPDEVYRLGGGDLPDLVVESLGELFVVELREAASGACWPTWVRWLERR